MKERRARAVRSNRSASSDWGTSDRSPQEILDAALNSKSTKVTFKDSKGKTFTDTEASALVNEKVKLLREAFRKWIWRDAARAQNLSEKYNRLYNNIAPRYFDGSHLTTPGLSARYKLHPHQKRAVWRILQTGNTYLAHAVGAGKTLEMIVSGMEQKRLGKISKPMYVVPNHMLKQFSAEFLEAYPLASILVADEQNFAKEKRQKFTAQAALNDLDAVIITHSAFGLLRTRKETADVVVTELVDQMRMAIDDLDETDTAQKRTIKDLENRIEKIEQKFGSMMDASGKDDVVSFEDLGVDFIYVDEAHEFRKLDFVTNRVSVKGIDPKGSQRSLDLLIKLRWLDSQRPGRSTVLASGTPITNTMAELYSIMRYLDPAELEAAQLAHFDAWSAQFGEVVADYEMNAAGNYEIVERFAKFINIPELMKRARKFMDVLTLNQLGSLINLPTIKGGTPSIKVVPATEAQTQYLKNELARRIEISRKWKPSREEPGNPDPLINIITDGRLAAIDMRFVDRRAENDPHSKLNVMIDSIIEKYHAGSDKVFYDKADGNPDALTGSTQIVFSAVGFGDQIAVSRGFDAKKWILKRLTEAGIPQSEIAFMGDYKLASAKERMFQEMRSGAKRILFGSPKNMGTGVNVQKRLEWEHYLSPPWYPADVEQPDGRILRQGNQNEEIGIIRYATKGTYDSTAWAMIARKSRAIEQAMTGDDSQRNLEDITESSQYEMASAVSAGDDRAIKLAGLRRDIERLERLRGAHSTEQRRIGHDQRRTEADIEEAGRRITRYDQAFKLIGGKTIPNDDFAVTVGTNSFEKRSEMGDALKKTWSAAIKANKSKVVSSKKPQFAEIGKALNKFPLVAEVYETSGGIVSKLALKVGATSYQLTAGNAVDLADIADLDGVGFATRIYNGLNSFAKSKLEAERELESAKRQLKQIKSKIGQPFAESQELYEKIAEYAELQEEMSKGDDAETGESENSPQSFLRQLKQSIASKAISKVIENYLDNSVFDASDLADWQGEPETLKSVFEPANDANFLFGQTIKKIQSGAISRNATISVGETPKVLRTIGAHNRTVSMPAEIVKKVTEDKHEIRLSTLNNLPSLLADPVMVFDSDSRENSLVVVLDARDKRGLPVIAAIHLDKTLGRLIVNNIASIYGKDRLKVFEEWIGKGLLKYVNAQKLPVWNTTHHLQLMGVVQTAQATSSIATEATVVKKFARNAPDTQKQIPEQKTLEQLRQLPYVSFDELLNTAKIENFGDRIQANAASHEIYRRAFEEARIRDGQTKRGANDTEDIFKGVFLKTETVAKTAAILEEKAAEAEKMGYSPEETDVLRDHAARLETAAQNNGTAIIYVFDDALPEEIFHQADYVGASDKSILNRHDAKYLDRLDDHPVARVMRRRLQSANEYKRFSGAMLKALMRAEIAPKIAEMSVDELSSIGLTEDLRDDYLLTWFEAYAAKNGTGALDNFEREELNVQRFIEKIKNAQNGEIRQNGQTNAEGSGAKQNQSGETRAGPRVSESRRDRKEESDLELQPNQKLASLPSTMRRAGIDAADIAYEVFGDKAAREAALKILAENGIEGSINILRSVNTPDVDHAVLSFMLQRILLDNAAQLDATNPQAADEFRTLAKELAREHALKAVKAGRFTRAASIIQNSVEGIVYTAQAIVREKLGNDKSLSAQELIRIESAAREAEEAVARAIQLQKEKRSLEQKLKRLQEEKEGKRKRRKSSESLQNRRKIVELIKKKNAVRVADVQRRLLAQFAPATLKSIIGESADLTQSQAEKLKEANNLESRRLSSSEIFARTGWERGVDGKWRYDLGEHVSVIHRNLREALLANKPMTLSDVLNAPQLFAAYPVIAQIKVVFERLGKNQQAYYDLEEKQIGLSNDFKWTRALGLTLGRGGGLTQILIHEVQHAIQQIEGFPQGTNSQTSGADGYRVNPGEVEARNAETRIELGADERRIKPISTTEDVSRQEQFAWMFSETEPATLKKIGEGDGFDDKTLNDFAEVGAMLLTEGMAAENEYLPTDFHAEMTAIFGDVIGAEFQEIYRRAWQIRDNWLSDIRTESAKERIRAKYDENISDEEIEEILGEHRDRAARRRAIEQIHRLASETKSKIKDGNELHRLILELTTSEDAAIVAWLMAQKFDIGEIYRELKKRKITEPRRQRQAIRDGSETLEKAKKQLLTEKAKIFDEIAETQRQLRNLDDARWISRENVRKAQASVRDELRRISSGEFAYRVGQFSDVLNVSRTLMASADLSGSLRQGGFFTFAMPEAQKEAFVNEFKSFTQKGYGRVIQDIENHPLFTLAQKSQLDFAEAGSADAGAMGEELYRGKETIEKIPILGFLLKKGLTGWSERTYTSFLDTQRMTMFAIFAEQLMAKKLTFEKNESEFKKIAEFINIGTGRGTIPTNRYAKLLLDLPFFAPRYTLSRLQLLNITLNPVAYYNLPPQARKIVAKSAARFYGTTAAILLIPALLGLVSFDPDDDDFLKIKVGNARYDIFAGELQPAKAILKVANAAIQTKFGQDERVRGEFWYDVADLDRGAIPRFVRGKLSPVASLVWDAAKGSDFVGNEFKWSKAILSRMMPLMLSEIYSAYQLDGAVGVAKFTPSIFGIGVSTYPERMGRPVTPAEKLAAKAAAMSFKSKPQTDEEKERQKIVADLVARMRGGADVAGEATRLVNDQKLTKDDVKKILERGEISLLEDKADNLSLDDFEAVFRLASQEEKARLIPILGKKMKNAEKDGKLSPSQRNRLEAMGGRVTGYVEMPERVKEAFERYEVRLPDVGESLTIRKGEKRKLSPDEYDNFRRESLTEIYRGVEKVLNSDGYKQAEDDKREELIRRAIRKARTKSQKAEKIELRKSS